MNKALIISCMVTLLCFSNQSCQKRKIDQSKITMRPKIFLEGASPVPLFDEYDIRGAQIGTVENIFSEDSNDRVFALWLNLDRRSSFYLQKETTMRLGSRLQLVSNGQILGIHPIEKTISNGIIPFILSTRMTEQGARTLYEQLGQSITYIQAELENEKR
jgi:hypothetical protein